MSKKKNTQRKRQAAEQRKPFAFRESYDVIIIGGGASGLACAVSCLREARAAGAALPNILLVEQGKRIGAPILRSGNGRCNFSNSQLDVSRYWNSAFVSQTLGFLGAPLPTGLKNWASYGKKLLKAVGCCIPFRTKLRRCWKCLWQHCLRMLSIFIPV